MSGKRITCLFFACWTLGWGFYLRTAGGCGCEGDPPGHPSCCWCADGVWVCECDEPCYGLPYGWTCNDGCYQACASWDPNDPISGSISMFPNTTSVPLCYNWIEFDSDVDDTDHFLIGDPWPPWTSYLYWYDTIVYAWSTNPSTGEWQGETSGSQALWQAPPCIGTVVVRLDVDDLPDEALGACPCDGEGNRDDDPNWFEIAIDVVLPEGCYEGSQYIKLEIDDVEPEQSTCDQIFPKCGYTFPVQREPLIVDITCYYSNCTWVFYIIATKLIESGVCHDNIINVSSDDYSALTEENYCAIVNHMNESTGCLDGGSVSYTNYECVDEHEQYHMDYFQNYLDLIAPLYALPEPVWINCSDPSTTTCQAVVAAMREQIETGVEGAYDHAYFYMQRNSEAGAIDAARACFQGVAAGICDYAATQNWSDPNCCQ